MFSAASHNVLVNGLPISEETGEQEPYDPQLHSQVQALQQELGKRVLDVAQKRKNIPKKCELLYEKHIKNQTLPHYHNTPTPSPFLDTEAVEIERSDDVKTSYNAALSIASDLKSMVPHSIGILEQVNGVLSAASEIKE